jgi:hypothetical protein
MGGRIGKKSQRTHFTPTTFASSLLMLPKSAVRADVGGSSLQGL